MSDDKLIEAMARALSVEMGDIDPDGPVRTKVGIVPAWKWFYEDAAAAALAAYRQHQRAAGIVEVPREPTEAMLAAVAPEPTHLYDDGERGPEYQRKMKVAVMVDRAALRSQWRDLLSASPDPTTDEALVERVKDGIRSCAAWSSFWSEDDARVLALAAIRAMEEKP